MSSSTDHPLRHAAELRHALLEWFDRHKRDLPWRRTRDPYAIWISEVMLQQTQVATVIPYWHRFLERFPTVVDLARAELPDVFAQWKGLGYYSRARNLHRAANEIVETFGGALPASADALRQLPGFGPYTSGAVASIAFGAEAPLVDGNVARVFSRWFEVDGAPGDRAREKQLWDLAGALVRGERPGDWNQALMELGATVCRVDNPTCLLCPVRAWCGAHARGRVHELPPPKVRAARKHLRLAVAVCRREDGALLFGRRAEGGLFGGLWELPTVELGAQATRAREGSAATAREAQRAFGELLGDLGVGAAIGTVKRALTHRDLELHLFEVTRVKRPPRSPEYQEWRWATAAEAGELGMSTAMAKALAVAVDSAPSPSRQADAMSSARRLARSVSKPQPRTGGRSSRAGKRSTISP